MYECVYIIYVSQNFSFFISRVSLMKIIGLSGQLLQQVYFSSKSYISVELRNLFIFGGIKSDNPVFHFLSQILYGNFPIMVSLWIIMLQS